MTLTTPAQLRDRHYAELQGKLEGDRRRVYDAFCCWGQATTRVIAQRSGLDILTARPRTTELFQAGLLRMVGRDGHEGVYEAVQLRDAVEAALIRDRPTQAELKLGV